MGEMQEVQVATGPTKVALAREMYGPCRYTGPFFLVVVCVAAPIHSRIPIVLKPEPHSLILNRQRSRRPSLLM